ncbi:MAG: NAD-dependent epimerase/dehydratase family protein [Pseudomonadota bacterium]|nr:NAD-dependent epimerase/dehydratase family protein [Pseudomonadota bacterium]
MHSVSIVGCGYTGLRLARCLRTRGHPVRGYAARTASLPLIAAADAEAALLNLDMPTMPLDFEGRVVYYLVPPAPLGDRDHRLERLLEGTLGKPRRFIYMSTTGVYGDHGGVAVDEQTPPAPVSERAVRRLAAENTLRRWADAQAVSWCVLRVPGIYGPGRLPLERLRRRDPAIDPSQAPPSNRIHVDDLVSACAAAGFAACANGRIYNVTDGSNDSLTAYLQRVARLGNLPSPPLLSRADATSLPAAARSFLAESRRVDNRRMLEELGVVLAFPDLDDGIRASL